MKKILIVLMLAALIDGGLFGQGNKAPPPVPSQEEPEVLNQGPIHEGFAQPLEIVPQEGIIAPNQPPADIVENPAAERPSGSEYVWIPGYWGWDTERQDYVWVSGCWRSSDGYVVVPWLLETSRARMAVGGGVLDSFVTSQQHSISSTTAGSSQYRPAAGLERYEPGLGAAVLLLGQ